MSLTQGHLLLIPPCKTIRPELPCFEIPRDQTRCPRRVRHLKWICDYERDDIVQSTEPPEGVFELSQVLSEEIRQDKDQGTAFHEPFERSNCRRKTRCSV